MTRETETVSFTYHTCDRDGRTEELDIQFDYTVYLDGFDGKRRKLSNFKAFDFDGSEIYDCIPFEKQTEITSLAINEAHIHYLESKAVQS